MGHERGIRLGAAYGEAFDRIMADDEMHGIVAAGKAADAPAVVDSSSLMIGIPIPGEQTAHGSVSEVHLARLTPGQLEEMLSFTEQAFGVARRNGAIGTRLFQLAYAGSMSDSYVTTFDYEDLAGFGAAMDRWATDPEGRSVGERLSSSDAPVKIISSSLYTAIPL